MTERMTPQQFLKATRASANRSAAHRNQLKTFSDEDLEFVEWLRAAVSPKIPGEQ